MKAPEKSFFVYVHKRNDTGAPFYVGKGHGRRHRNQSTRSDWWKRIVAKHGFTVETPYTNLSEQCAFSIERALIAAYRGCGQSLVNATEGGEGPIGRVPSELHRKRMADAKRGKKQPAEVVKKRAASLRGQRRSDATRALLSKRARERYADRPKKVNRGYAARDRNANYDPTEHRFLHEIYGERFCTKNALMHEFGLSSQNLTAMVKGRIKTTLGWRLAGGHD